MLCDTNPYASRGRRAIFHITMARDEKLEHLKRVPLFAHMGSRELERLGQLADEVELGLDQVLTQQGKSGSEFFIVLSGRMTVLQDGRPVSNMGPGDFFGEIALVEERPRTATVRTDGIARLLVINHREFHELMDEFPAIRQAVLQALADRVRKDEPGTT